MELELYSLVFLCVNLVLTYWETVLQWRRTIKFLQIYLIRAFQNWSVGECHFQTSNFSSSTFQVCKTLLSTDSLGSWVFRAWKCPSQSVIWSWRTIFLANSGQEGKEYWKQKSQETLNLRTKRELWGKKIFLKWDLWRWYHDSIVGHLDDERTLKTLSFGGHGWAGMRISFGWFHSVPYVRNRSSNVNQIGRTKRIIVFIIWILWFPLLWEVRVSAGSVERGQIGKRVHYRYSRQLFQTSWTVSCRTWRPRIRSGPFIMVVNFWSSTRDGGSQVTSHL